MKQCPIVVFNLEPQLVANELRLVGSCRPSPRWLGRVVLGSRRPSCRDRMCSRLQIDLITLDNALGGISYLKPRCKEVKTIYYCMPSLPLLSMEHSHPGSQEEVPQARVHALCAKKLISCRATPCRALTVSARRSSGESRQLLTSRNSLATSCGSRLNTTIAVLTVSRPR